MNGLLITRPEHDTTTFYLSQWSKMTVKVALDKGIKVLDCCREKANKNTVENMLTERKPGFVVFNGHGSYDEVTGHKNEVLVKAGQNEKLLKEKIVYAISCRSAAQLGQESVRAGAFSYVGYNEDFIFVFDKSKTATPINDETARNFFVPSNVFIESILKGNSVKEAHERSQSKFRDNIKKLLVKEVPPGSEVIVKYLIWDMKHQVRLGQDEVWFG